MSRGRTPAPSDVVRFGIVGCGDVTEVKSGPAFQKVSGSALTAVMRRDGAKARDYAERHGVPRWTDDAAELIAGDDVDAVYVATPPSSHLEYVRMAAQAGKPVYVEKPMGTTLQECDAMLGACRRAGVPLFVAYYRRALPRFERVRELLQEGAIGDLLRVNATFTYDNSGDPGNIRNSVETGGGSLPDIGVYTLGCTRFVTGKEPEKVLFADIRRENGVEVRTEALAQFDGFTLTSLTSMRMTPYQNVSFHGSKGVIEVVTGFNPLVHSDAELRVTRQGQLTETLRYPGANHYVLQVEAFGAAVRGEADFPCPLEFSLGTQRFIDMIWAAEG